MMSYTKGRLRLEDFEKIKDYNEMDLVRRMRELLSQAEELAENTVKGNKASMVDLRRFMNDNKNLSMILRDMVKIRMGRAKENRQLASAIAHEKAAIELENKRPKDQPYEFMIKRIERARLAEEKKKQAREQKIKESRARSVGGEHQKAQDEL